MAVTNEDLERVRNELEAKINSVNVDHVNMAQAIGSYGERFTAVDRQLDATDFRIDALSADMDRRFDMLSADMDRRFSDVRSDVARLDGRIDRLESKLDAGLDRLDSKFDAGLDRVDSKFEANIKRLDANIHRLDVKLDARFNVQTVLMTVLGVLVLFGDSIRSLIGL